MKAPLFALLAAIVTGCAPASATVGNNAGENAGARHVAITYQVGIETPPAGPLELWVPLPADDAHQRVRDLRIDASIPGSVQNDPTYGNPFWHGSVVDATDPVTVQVDIDLDREPVVGPTPDPRPTDRERALFLGPNRLVPVSGDLVERIRADLPPGDGTPSGRAHDIFEYVVDNLEYKKVGTGWGQGSTEWACSAKYGNCTDFHALFTSLARAEGLPTRFHIGFPLPEGEASGVVGGYHCWLDVWTDDGGWLSVDASEAWKHKDNRERWFSSLPADRVRFTTGRDLRLGQRGEPLNYFVYPYAEVAGVPFDGVTARVSFHEL